MELQVCITVKNTSEKESFDENIECIEVFMETDDSAVLSDPNKITITEDNIEIVINTVLVFKGTIQDLATKLAFADGQ